MRRVPNTSSVYRSADRTLDPGSFSNGDFCIVRLVRPDVWDPLKEPYVDDEQLHCESAWEVANIYRYNMDRPLRGDEPNPTQPPQTPGVPSISSSENPSDDGDDVDLDIGRSDFDD